jgi:hypothetical protein
MIADCGMRIADLSRIADGGLRIAEHCLHIRQPHSEIGNNPQSAVGKSTINPQSAIRNPQCR